MDVTLIWQAVLLGIVEGLTEFIPVSSTGHLILLVELLGFRGPPGKVFEVVIQLGAILAVCILYFWRLWRSVVALPSEAEARRFAATVILAFLPAAVVGVLLHGFIKSVLFSPYVVCASLFAGGIAIIVIERVLPTPRHATAERIPPLTGLWIGCLQTLAMIPGVSRAGATILGALLLGVERRAAAEFSFFLSIPTMLGAAVYDLYKNRAVLSLDGSLVIALGFIVSFLAAGLVVRAVVDFIGRHGFAPFGWYRIALSVVMLAVLTAV